MGIIKKDRVDVSNNSGIRIIKRIVMKMDKRNFVHEELRRI